MAEPRVADGALGRLERELIIGPCAVGWLTEARVLIEEAQSERDALAARVAALEAQRDEALKALEIREDEPQRPYYPYERIREARRILSITPHADVK